MSSKKGCKLPSYWLESNRAAPDLFSLLNEWTEIFGTGRFRTGPAREISVRINEGSFEINFLDLVAGEERITRTYLAFPERVRMYVDTLGCKELTEGDHVKAVSVHLAMAEYELERSQLVETVTGKERA